MIFTGIWTHNYKYIPKADGPGPSLCNSSTVNVRPHDRLLPGFFYPLWSFNIAMENDPFIDDFPIKTTIYRGFSMAMLNNQMVHPFDVRSNLQSTMDQRLKGNS